MRVCALDFILVVIISVLLEKKHQERMGTSDKHLCLRTLQVLFWNHRHPGVSLEIFSWFKPFWQVGNPAVPILYERVRSPSTGFGHWLWGDISSVLSKVSHQVDVCPLKSQNFGILGNFGTFRLVSGFRRIDVFFFVVVSQKCVNICHHLPVMSPGQVRFCISAAHTIPQLREVSAVFFSGSVHCVSMWEVFKKLHPETESTLFEDNFFQFYILYFCLSCFCRWPENRSHF